MMINEIEKYVIPIDATYQYFIRKIDRTKLKALFVVDDQNKFVGTVTEGDSRRFIIKTQRQPRVVSEFYNSNAIIARHGEEDFNDIYKFDMSKGEIPILDSRNFIVGLITADSITPKLNQLEKKKFTVIAPTRVGFAGGGSDLAKWFKDQEGLTLNLAIQKYAMVNFSPNQTEVISIYSCNTNDYLELDISKIESYDQEKLKLIVNCIKKFDVKSGFDLKINCDFEPGTGLGGSSALTIATLRGLAHFQNFEISPDQLFKLAYEIERVQTGILGGWQDFIPATYGGLCYTKYQRSGIFVQNIALSRNKIDFLSSALFIVRVGQRRMSSSIHENISKTIKDKKYIENMKRIVSLVDESLDIIGKDLWQNLGRIMDKGWNYKKQMNNDVSNSTIDKVYDFLTDAGAIGGRLLGAGGGGYLLMFVPLENQANFVRSCKDKKLEFERIRIDVDGVRLVGEN